MSLFIGNIAGEISQKELEDLFSKYGKCEIKHKNVFAFVEYSSDKEAEQAKQELDKKEINGRVLSIEWSKKSKNYISKRYKESVRCYTCGRKGHFARDCHDRKRSSPIRRYGDRRYRSRSRSRSRYRSRRRYNRYDSKYDSSSESNRSRYSRSRDNKYRRRSRSRKRSDDSYYRDRDRNRERDRYRRSRSKRSRDSRYNY